MKEKLIKCTVKTANGFIFECELSYDTIFKLQIINRVSVREIQK